MQLPTLREIFEAHDRLGSDKWTTYFGAYDDHFARFRERPITLLEIGIQNGGSLEIWAKYFANATRIVGCDIDEKCRDLTFEDPRISVVIGDANSANSYQAVTSDVAAFDIVVDDGSHLVSDVIQSFALYFPKVKPGGVYVIEDLHTSYWEGFGGGSDLDLSSMGFLKLLADVVNKEFWRDDRVGFNLLQNYASRYDVAVNDAGLEIDEVAFGNSVCIIRKKVLDGEENRRHITGNVFKVLDYTEVKPLSGSKELLNSLHITRNLMPATARQAEFVQLSATTLENVRRIEQLDAELRTVSTSANEALTQAQQEIASANDALASVNDALAHARQEIASLKNSYSWRLTAPLRYMRLTTPLRYVKAVFRH